MTGLALRGRPLPARRRSRGQGRSAFLFLAPFFLFFGVFMLAPIAYALGRSFFSEQASGLGFGGGEPVFVGFDNFARALTDPRFLQSFANIGTYVIVYIPIMIGLALTIALLLDSAAARARSFFRVSYYLPTIVPGLIASLIWLYLYTPGVSPLVQAVESAGLTWSLDTPIAGIFAITNVSTWLHTGYNIILFYAALQSVPKEVLESAKVDGAGPFRTSLQIKTPMIKPALTLAVLFTVVGAMQIFAEPLLLRSRASAITSTWAPNMYIYEVAFGLRDNGLAAAASVILALVIGLMSFLVTRLGRRADS